MMNEIEADRKARNLWQNGIAWIENDTYKPCKIGFLKSTLTAPPRIYRFKTGSGHTFEEAFATCTFRVDINK